MTHEEFKATGKDGVYRADLDEWFIEGEEPPKVGSNQLLDNLQADDAKGYSNTVLPSEKTMPAPAPVVATPVAESTPVSEEKPLTKTGAKK